MGQLSIAKELWEQLPPEFQTAISVGVSPNVALGEPVEMEVEGVATLIWDDERLPNTEVEE